MRDIVTRLRDMLPDTPWSEDDVTVSEACEEIKRLRNDANASAHVLIENGVIPGITAPCRCEECRHIAQLMDDANYLDRVTDRWWENNP